MICNKDCFNCIYDDCINDSVDIEDYKNNLVDEINTLVTRKQQRNRSNYKKYREANLEKERERDRVRYSNESERRQQNHKEWYQNNKEYRKLYYKQWYENKKAKERGVVVEVN